jgi:uracil-DNA glycosylase
MKVLSRCVNCDLCISAKTQFVTHYNDNAEIMFLLPHPNPTQDKNGNVVEGRNMKQFYKVLTDRRIADITSISFALKCKPAYVERYEYENHELTVRNCCSLHFAKEYETMCNANLKLIVTFGKFSYQFITNTRYIKQDDFKKICFKPVQPFNVEIYPMPDLSELLKANTLNDAVADMLWYYANKYNKKLLIKKDIKGNIIINNTHSPTRRIYC